MTMRSHKILQRCCCCCCPGAGGTSRITGRPGTGLGAGPRGGCWLPPAAAMAAPPAWRSASASSLLKNTKICIIANYSTVKYLSTYVPVLLMWRDNMKKNFELHKMCSFQSFKWPHFLIVRNDFLVSRHIYTYMSCTTTELQTM